MLFFVILRLCQGDGSSTKSLGMNILWPHAKLLPASISFIESVEGQCMLTVWRVEKNRRIPERIGSLVDNKRCLHFLLWMAPQDDGNYCFEPCWVEVEGRIMKEINPSVHQFCSPGSGIFL